jgi:hypothetical protein
MVYRGRYWMFLLGSLAVFVAMNLLSFLRSSTIIDGINRHGFPFPFFLDGGFGGIRQLFWVRLTLDLMVLLVFSAAISWIWNRFVARNSAQVGQK